MTAPRRARTALEAPEADEGVWMDSDTVEDAYEASDAAELEPEPEDEQEDD